VPLLETVLKIAIQELTAGVVPSSPILVTLMNVSSYKSHTV
jgi:hypothetical protein